MCPGSMKPWSCISLMPSSLVAPHTPACVVTGTPSSRATSNAAFSGNSGIAGDVERHLEAEHVVAAPEPPLDELPEVLRRRPLPRALLDVPVGEHEAAGDRLQRVDGGVGVVDGLQPVRPVDGGGHARVDRLERRQQVAGRDVLRAEDLAPLEVEEDEVLGQRPVGAVAAQRGLPHMPVGVDHPRHDDAVGGVDLLRALRRLEPGADAGDLVVDDEDVRPVQDVVGVVHGQNGASAEDDAAHVAPFGMRTSFAPAPLRWRSQALATSASGMRSKSMTMSPRATCSPSRV